MELIEAKNLVNHIMAIRVKEHVIESGKVAGLVKVIWGTVKMVSKLEHQCKTIDFVNIANLGA